jgi:hypothetical protein
MDQAWTRRLLIAVSWLALFAIVAGPRSAITWLTAVT